jgi:histidinol-phosphatase
MRGDPISDVDANPTALFAPELAFALELADVATAITMSRFGGRSTVTRKHDGTAVTEADVAAEEAIRAAIASAFPTDGMLGEETGRTEGTSGRTWVVDPIDGTANYADGVPLWTTLIGLEVDGDAVVGVADAPAVRTRYQAVRGGGAFMDGGAIHSSEVADLADAFIIHSPTEEWITGDRLDDLIRIVSSARRTRGLSDAWGHLLVAQGSAEALVERQPCFPWDWTATSVILREAGGVISSLRGQTPTPGEGLVVSNGAVHDALLAALSGGGSARDRRGR